jgi:hypothetical protein
MNEWITDRLPTNNDVSAMCDLVFVSFENGIVNTCSWYKVKKGQPWQCLKIPAHYVKPKRWRVKWNVDTWILVDRRLERSYWCGLGELGRNGEDAAQRIADVLNEEMP